MTFLEQSSPIQQPIKSPIYIFHFYITAFSFSVFPSPLFIPKGDVRAVCQTLSHFKHRYDYCSWSNRCLLSHGFTEQKGKKKTVLWPGSTSRQARCSQCLGGKLTFITWPNLLRSSLLFHTKLASLRCINPGLCTS